MVQQSKWIPEFRSRTQRTSGVLIPRLKTTLAQMLGLTGATAPAVAPEDDDLAKSDGTSNVNR